MLAATGSIMLSPEAASAISSVVASAPAMMACQRVLAVRGFATSAKLRSKHTSFTPALLRLQSRSPSTLTSSTASISALNRRLASPEIARVVNRTFSTYVGEEHSIIGSKLIPLVNRLQEAFAITGTTLDLPQIVVVGSQSSGKSSVLENLVGKDFLPRGSGIVTRRPLVLQLQQVEGNEEWGEFTHTPEKFKDFSKIREEIERETNRLTGKNKGVSPEPIILRIYSPKVVPLTLVDTPGIARVAVGDQPTNIEEQIKAMVLQFIKPSNSIILAVSPANQDLATSDALKLAREVDPEGKRTVGVLIKLDLMDEGTNALEVLENRAFPLRLGFVGVVSRSQKDIQTNKEISKMLNDEQQFFKKHPVYKSIADRSGTRFLGQKLNKVLTEHIEDTLPQLKSSVLTEIKKVKEELELWGGSTHETPQPKDQGWLLLQMLNAFAVDFRDALKGQLPTLNTGELNGGARIGYIFNESFGRYLHSLDPTTSLTTSQYLTALRNASGAKDSIFIPQTAFENLIKQQIERMREPSLQAAELVLNELLRILTQLETKDMIRFPTLRDRVVEVCGSVLRKCLYPTNDMINNIINCELAYINTSHPDFVNGFLNKQPGDLSSATIGEEPPQPKPQKEAPKQSSGGFFSSIFGSKSQPAPEKPPSPAPSRQRPEFKLEEPPSDIRIRDGHITANEQRQISLIKALLRSYFEIVSKGVHDSVVKAIWHFLVDRAQTELHRSLVAELYKPELLENLLQEPQSVVSRREELLKQLHALRKAKKILQFSQLRDFDEAPQF